MRKLLPLLAALLLCATGASAQAVSGGGGSAPARTIVGPTNITTNGGTVTLDTAVGFATMSLQVTNTYVGTLKGQCSVDGTNFADIQLFPSDSSSGLTELGSGDNGVWSATIAGCRKVQVTTTSWTSGTATITMVAVASGGGGGGGGGGSAVSIVQGGNTAAVNASGQLSTICANCTGSGVSQQDNTGFTPGTTLVAPIGAEVDDTGTTATSENNAGGLRMTGQRALHTNLRKADGTELATSSNPLRTDPTGTTSQPVTNATASNLQAQVAQKASVSTSGTLQSASGANGNGSTLSVDGMGTVVVTVNCNTCSGGTTVNFEATEDGTNYTAREGHRLGTDTTIASFTATSGVTIWEIPVAGFVTFRARISSYSAGTVTVTAHAVPLSSDLTSKNVNANQAGTWTVQPGNTANSTPWLFTVNQGGNSAEVNASGQLSVNCGNCTGSGVSQQDNTAFTAGTTPMVPIGGIFDDTGSATATENSAAVARITSNKALHINLRNNSGSEVGTSGSPLRIDPTGATTQPVSIAASVTVAQATASNLKTQSDTELPAAVTAADDMSNPTAPQVLAHLMCWDSSGSNWDRCPPTDGGSGASTANTPRGIAATDSPDVVTLGATGDSAVTAGSTGSISGKLRQMSADLDAIKTALQLIDDDQTGMARHPVISAASDNSTSVVGSAARLLGIWLKNTTTTTYYLRLYNTSSAPTCSSNTGFVVSIPIPAASAAGLVGGTNEMYGPSGFAFGNGIGYCITAGSGDTDTTSAATGLMGLIGYK